MPWKKNVFKILGLEMLRKKYNALSIETQRHKSYILSFWTERKAYYKHKAKNGCNFRRHVFYPCNQLLAIRILYAVKCRRTDFPLASI